MLILIFSKPILEEKILNIFGILDTFSFFFFSYVQIKIIDWNKKKKKKIYQFEDQGAQTCGNEATHGQFSRTKQKSMKTLHVTKVKV